MSERQAEIEGIETPEPTQVRRLCSTCLKVKVCKAYEAMVSTKKSFEMFDFIKFPMEPEQLAITCTEYLSPIANHNEQVFGK